MPTRLLSLSLSLSLIPIPGPRARSRHEPCIMSSDQSPRDLPRPKQRRISRACDYCHRRSIRCRPAEDGTGCQNCRDFAQTCTYHRKPRRRGVPARGSGGAAANRDAVEGVLDAKSSRSPSLGGGDLRIIPEIQHPGPYANASPQSSVAAWRAPYIVSQATVVDLVELYFEMVYPIFPFFHQPSFTRKISRAEYNTNQPLFATTMAVCALVGGRVRDGSVMNPRWDVQALQRETLPDTFYAEARRQLLEFSVESSDFNILRAHAIVAIAAIQNGKVRDMHYHLGIYHTLMAMDGLHDEANWPSGIGIIEREERRRMVSVSLTSPFCRSDIRYIQQDGACPANLAALARNYTHSFGRSIPWTSSRLWSGAVSSARGSSRPTSPILPRWMTSTSATGALRGQASRLAGLAPPLLASY